MRPSATSVYTAVQALPRPQSTQLYKPCLVLSLHSCTSPASTSVYTAVQALPRLEHCK